MALGASEARTGVALVTGELETAVEVSAWALEVVGAVSAGAVAMIGWEAGGTVWPITWLQQTRKTAAQTPARRGSQRRSLIGLNRMRISQQKTDGARLK